MSTLLIALALVILISMVMHRVLGPKIVVSSLRENPFDKEENTFLEQQAKNHPHVREFLDTFERKNT
jgi:hypothetical protein